MNKPIQHYDFVAIGSGPAGRRAAIQAGKLGKKVAIVERDSQVGGVALHTGTIPSKTLRESILYLTGWRQRGFYGHDYRVKSDITVDDLSQRLQVIVRREIELMQAQLSRNNVEIIHGLASFVDPHLLEINSSGGDTVRLKADKILLATGSRPRRPDNIPFDDSHIVDADGLLKLSNIPRSMVIIGAGVIGSEYATMFNTMDIQTTLINKRETMLEFVDREIMEEYTHSLRDSGMQFRLGEELSAIEKQKKRRRNHTTKEWQTGDF